MACYDIAFGYEDFLTLPSLLSFCELFWEFLKSRTTAYIQSPMAWSRDLIRQPTIICLLFVPRNQTDWDTFTFLLAYRSAGNAWIDSSGNAVCERYDCSLRYSLDDGQTLLAECI
ncbi:hypothetical protein AVEN_54522-1 [Araneus ventricosus]|uniref:Uncharacterized protein n=1 Tax=Araneus ventricosus TaxID=182803 RepID=A0A4Y2EIY5_ARAVE|nr:hypothetical protein AVEN_54522-1 [Araneus ventricosus]